MVKKKSDFMLALEIEENEVRPTWFRPYFLILIISGSITLIFLFPSIWTFLLGVILLIFGWNKAQDHYENYEYNQRVLERMKKKEVGK